MGHVPKCDATALEQQQSSIGGFHGGETVARKKRKGGRQGKHETGSGSRTSTSRGGGLSHCAGDKNGERGEGVPRRGREKWCAQNVGGGESKVQGVARVQGKQYEPHGRKILRRAFRAPVKGWDGRAERKLPKRGRDNTAGKNSKREVSGRRRS